MWGHKRQGYKEENQQLDLRVCTGVEEGGSIHDDGAGRGKGLDRTEEHWEQKHKCGDYWKPGGTKHMKEEGVLAEIKSW